jgi:hypothetical protein
MPDRLINPPFAAATWIVPPTPEVPSQPLELALIDKTIAQQSSFTHSSTTDRSTGSPGRARLLRRQPV